MQPGVLHAGVRTQQLLQSQSLPNRPGLSHRNASRRNELPQISKDQHAGKGGQDGAAAEGDVQPPRRQLEAHRGHDRAPAERAGDQAG